LLRQLSQEVPGTFQHSLQVANLAEEAIYYIGGNTLLVRTGAMYHDVGKLSNPRFFTENQVNGYSPHMEMLPLESAKTIINHVIRGIELAKEHGLPEQVIDFIRTHHGTTYVGYFLNLHKKDKVLTNVDENEFRYPGPIPFSKETAVLMMADGVEAASRSLPKKDALAINDLVDQIIDYKISQNQFINSDITFKDITIIKKIFKKRLMNIYHVRIEYPTQ
jgi:putative nucleotidyltransferase with HDIG domain